MAGRGVDIKLGGNPGTPEDAEKVKGAGGLFVLGTERHEARRIDNQLRGRAGRQGDPGETQFFVSLEDSLMRVFASDTIKRVMGTFGIPEDEPIFNGMITRSLEKAQTKIEEFNFDARKHVLSYDDVLNIQRKSVYEKRRALLIGGDAAFEAELSRIAEGNDTFAQALAAQRTALGASFSPLVRRFLLQNIDQLWVDHLEAMEYLRNSVNLRAYGQRDPLVEYKKEGLRLFQTMNQAYEANALEVIPRIVPAIQQQAAQAPIQKAIASITAQDAAGTAGEPGRNDRVRITNGTETRELKFKKAEPLIQSGEWKIVE
jgi:preprotein translocase subunit SecA